MSAINQPDAGRTERLAGLDPSIPSRVQKLQAAFDAHFGEAGDRVLAYAPGRAEILGNHTDYNQGYTLSANITHNVLLVARRRDDGLCRIVSLNMGDGVQERAIDTLTDVNGRGNGDAVWTDYVWGVLWALIEAGHHPSGFDAVLESTVPLGGGTSSSAALETAVARAVCALSELDLGAEEQIELCHRAESAYVGAPVGYLDQATVGLAEDWLLMSYRPEGGRRFTWELVSADLSKAGFTLLVGFDPDSAHQLTDGKYGERRAACEASIEPLQELLGRPLSALRDVSVAEFNQVVGALETKVGRRVTGFVEHIVRDNDRVLQAYRALREDRVDALGGLMTESGRSSIELYDLAEGAPELRFVYDTAVQSDHQFGIRGVRNMGGGFTATTLMLVESKSVELAREELSRRYEAEFGRPYNLIDFVPAPAAGILNVQTLNV